MADRFVTVTDFGRNQLQAVDLGGLFDHRVGTVHNSAFSVLLTPAVFNTSMLGRLIFNVGLTYQNLTDIIILQVSDDLTSQQFFTAVLDDLLQLAITENIGISAVSSLGDALALSITETVGVQTNTSLGDLIQVTILDDQTVIVSLLHPLRAVLKDNSNRVLIRRQ